MRWRRRISEGEYETIRQAVLTKTLQGWAGLGVMSVEDIVSQAVADTLLIVEGSVKAEAFTRGMSEEEREEFHKGGGL